MIGSLTLVLRLSPVQGFEFFFDSILASPSMRTVLKPWLNEKQMNSEPERCWVGLDRSGSIWIWPVVLLETFRPGLDQSLPGLVSTVSVVTFFYSNAL